MPSYHCPDPDSLGPAAREILDRFKNERIFVLQGPMGSGKTTLVKAFCGALGCPDSISSPTFTIVNEYLSGTGEPVYHFDLYRTNSAAELRDLGFEDYLYSGSYCFIEWPEKAAGLLPGNEVAVTLEVTENARIISVNK